MTDKLEMEDDGDNSRNENGNNDSNEKNETNDNNEKKKNSNNNNVEMNEFEENDDENENENIKQKPRYRRRKVSEMSRDDRDESTIVEKERLLKNPKRIHSNVSQEWKCPNCSFTNQSLASTCLLCETFRPAAITSNNNHNNNNNNLMDNGNGASIDHKNDEDESNEQLLSNNLSFITRNSNLDVSNEHGNNNYNNNNINGNDDGNEDEDEDDDDNNNKQMKSSHSPMSKNDSSKTMCNEHERSILLQFVEYTNATRDVGLKCLTRTQWDVQKALALYFDENPNPSKSRQASQAFGVDDITKILDADAAQIADDDDLIASGDRNRSSMDLDQAGIDPNVVTEDNNEKDDTSDEEEANEDNGHNRLTTAENIHVAQIASLQQAVEAQIEEAGPAGVAAGTAAIIKDKVKAPNEPNKSNEAIDEPVEASAPNALNAAAMAAAAAVTAEESQMFEMNGDDNGINIEKEKDNGNGDDSDNEYNYNARFVHILSKVYSVTRCEATKVLHLCNGDIELAKQKLTKYKNYKSKQKGRRGMQKKNRTTQPVQKDYLKNGSINININNNIYNSTGTIHKYKNDKDGKE